MKISICIPAYNYAQYLTTAIESARNQREAPWEIVVSDNHSTDDTAAVLRRFMDKVRIVRPPYHLSQVGHFYFVASQATGSHIVLLAADDALAPSFVTEVRPYLKHYGMVATGRFNCDSSMHVTGYEGASYGYKHFQPPAGFFHFLRACDYTISGAVFSREALLSSPRLPDDAGMVIDWYFALVTGLAMPVRLLWKPLVYYRCHSQNISHKHSARYPANVIQLFEFLIAEPSLPAAYRAAVEEREREFVRKLLLVCPLSEYQQPLRETIERSCRKWFDQHEWSVLSRAADSARSEGASAATSLKITARAFVGQMICRSYEHPSYLVAGEEAYHRCGSEY